MSETAFLDVDTQVDFIQPSGKLYAQGAEAILPNLARLVGFARAQGIPLVASVDAHGEGDAEFAQFPPHCLQGTPGQTKVAETRSGEEVFVTSTPQEQLPDPTQGHVVLEKQELNVFSNPNAERVFAATGARRFVVFGVVTECCVKLAAQGLLERGYQVDVVRDAIWPIAPAGGEAALQELVAQGARLTTTEQILQQPASKA